MEVQIPESLSLDMINNTNEDSIMINKTVDKVDDREIENKGGGDHEPSAETSLDVASSNSNENDIINVDDIEWSDEDSWLYSSPKKLTSEEKEVSPYKWLRKDVEDPENLELQMAKTALVSKLEELDILSFQSLNKSKEEVAELEELIPGAGQSFDSSFDAPQSSEAKKSSILQKDNLLNDSIDISTALSDGIKTCDSTNNGDMKEEEKLLLCGTRPLNNATDVHEIARLQEESLRRSSPKLSLLPEGRVSRSTYYFSPECERQRLQKPVSVEALHKCEDRQSPPVVLSFGTMSTTAKSSPHHSPFGSTSSLNYAQDVHRSSLPNLNRGYYSLRPKKSKLPSEPKIQCPLPIYPGHHKGHPNGSMAQTLAVLTQQRNSGPLNCDYRETRTLPSSYRMKAQKLPLARKELLVPKLNARRESAPSPLCHNAPSTEMSQRELPATRCGDAFYPKKQSNAPCRISSPVSPRKALVPTNAFQRHGSSPVLHNPYRASQEALNHMPNFDQKSPHSSSPRQPLSSVHNQPANNDRLLPASEGRKLSLPSKIPGPSIRSGIPVPSTPYISRTSPTEETWSHGCF